MHHLFTQSSAGAFSNAGFGCCEDFVFRSKDLEDTGCFEQAQESFQDQLVTLWQTRLLKDYPQQDAQTRRSIICWLLDDKIQPFTPFSNRLVININRRYQILQQRYLYIESTQAYANLVEQLLSSMTNLDLGCQERHQQRVMVGKTQKILQELLAQDAIQRKIVRIAKYTTNSQLRKAFLLAELEEFLKRRHSSSPF